jgi:hypothetical protein
VLLGVGAVAWRKEWRASDRLSFAVFCWAAGVSYLLLSSFANLFLRNSIAVGALFVMSLALLSSAGTSSWVRRIVISLLVINLLLGIRTVVAFAFQSGGMVADPEFMLLTPVPIARYWTEIVRTVDTIDCRGNVRTTCSIYMEPLRREGVRGGPVDASSGPCLFGEHPPPAGGDMTVVLKTKDGRVGQLCFP